MKKLLLLPALLAFAFTANAQTPQIGTAAWAAQHSQYQRNGGPAVNPLNGNDTLTTTYSMTACGLNYTMTTQRLGQRFIPVGVPQPAPYQVSIPQCATVLKAYLYTEVLDVAPNINATITNPANVTSVFPMTLIGSSVDVCWGMNGTHVWRADVTSCITGSGAYMIDSIPTSPNTAFADAEGATLIVIYSDPAASYNGTLIIDDGCYTVQAGPLSHTMTNINACANSTSASVFMLVGDMQMTGYTLTMNGNNVPQPQWNWWNEISAQTSVTSGQNTCSYTLTHGGDCYTLAVAGLYFQTNCQTCTPMASSMSTTTSTTPDYCHGNGTATVSVSGGSGNYTYVWLPGGQTTATATGLAGGTYTVSVNDGSSCTTAIVNVPNTNMQLSISSTPITCQSTGSATVTVSGGAGPFTYSWSSGGTAATENNLSAGSYTVTVTDVGTGCTDTATVTVANNLSLYVSAYSQPDNCSTSSGSLSNFTSGGTPGYTFSWMPGGYTTGAVSGVSAGTYTLTVTDAAGCTATAQTTVANNIMPPVIYAPGPIYVSCGGSNIVYVSCNISNATFNWSPATYLSSTNTQSATCTPLSNITYTVTATTGCGSTTDTLDVYIDTNNYYSEAICFVTVDTSLNKNIVIWERWNSPPAGSYNIYKETSVLGVYALAGSQPISQYTTFIDMASNPQVMADRYMITTVDSCGNESDTSFHHRTIHLQTTSNGNGGWNLSWTAYEGLPIATYNIYRGASLNTLSLLTQVAGNVFTYTDLTPPPGQQYYFVEAVHPWGGCAPSRTSNPSSASSDYNHSVSNIAYTNPAGIADANAFINSLALNPNPGNGDFRLGIQLGGPETITVTIFDQLGQIVYTQNLNAGGGKFTTDIRLNGISSGVYLVQVKTGNGIASRKLVIE